jgi:NADH:ubiquinone oxidoreductase subunit 3 (subunit A)
MWKEKRKEDKVMNVERVVSIRDVTFYVSAILFIIFMIGMAFSSIPYQKYEEKQFIYKTVDSVKYQPQIKDIQNKMDNMVKSHYKIIYVVIVSILLLIISGILSIVIWICDKIEDKKFKGKYKQ